jgi:hypothetical protein
MHDFTIEGSTRMTDRPRMQQHGDWEGFNYLDHLTVHIEGDLIRDTTELYIAARMQLMAMLHPPPGRQKSRIWGTLTVKYFGFEAVKNRTTGDSYASMPMSAQAPSTVGPYMIQWKVFDPYWTGVGTGNRYLI